LHTKLNGTNLSSQFNDTNNNSLHVKSNLSNGHGHHNGTHNGSHEGNHNSYANYNNNEKKPIMTFGGSDKCARCLKAVYAAEKLAAAGKVRVLVV
jgi:hypothetical protein